MDLRREQQIHQLFLRTLEKPSEARRFFLERACSQDAELLSLVLNRLEGVDAIEGNIRHFGKNSGASNNEDIPTKPDHKHIGPYKIVRKLGEGGMGVVYLAERADGEFHRNVAIKVIRSDLNSSALIQRFRRERQIMANLQHHYIATLHDGGSSEDGSPYFVMEYVEGQFIDKYARDQCLSLKQRLALFLMVCEGVAFAHRKGVVHRDIKPSNILVTRWGEPKLLDFGIASMKSDPKLTAVGEKLMTPAYASPEQVRGESAGIASDVYSLGVLLYSLISGRHPFSLDDLPAHEIARVICEETPPRPSTLVAETEDQEVSDSELTELSGLDKIVLKALDKNPKNRFDSATRMVESIRFFQEGLQIINPSEKPYDLILCCMPQNVTEANRIADQLSPHLAVCSDLGVIDQQFLEGSFLEQCLDASRCCLILVGAGKKQTWHHRQFNEALGVRTALGSIRADLVLLPDGRRPSRETALPRFLRRRSWLSVRGDDCFENLVKNLTSILEPSPDPVSGSIGDQACPFRGLEAFDEGDRRFFFGRESLTQRLIQNLQESRFLAVIGPSGSGKSSLVRAGLIPELREADVVVAMTPTAQPVVELAFAVHHFIAENHHAISRDRILRALRQRKTALHELIGTTPRRFFLVIDQFEELFTLTANHRDRDCFIDNIIHAVDQLDGQVSVVLTMRSDFLGQCAYWADLNSFVIEHLIQVEPMSREESKKVVEEPARMVGLAFEEGLVSRILEDVSGAPGELPLLQHALLELYEQREDALLTAAAYTRIGGIEGALTRRAEAEFAELDEQEQEVLRSMFVLCLIQTVDGAEDTRRAATRDEILAVDENPEVVEGLLQRWTASRLLTVRVDESRGLGLIEVAHEALIRRWERLKIWMAEDRATTRLVNRLRRQARVWQEAGHVSELLPRGTQLAQMDELLQKRSSSLGALEKEFVTSGLDARDRQARRQEERRNRELEAARALAFRSRMITVITFVGLLVFSYLTWQLKEKDTITQELLAGSYWRESRTALENRDPDLAVHLAATALNTLPSSVARKSYLLHYHMLARHIPWPLYTMRHDDHVAGVLLDSSQLRVLSWSSDHTVRLWDAGTGEPLTPPMRHDDGVWGAAFSHDNSRVLSWGFDGTLRLWNAATGEAVGEPMRHDGLVWGAMFDSSDTRILSWSFDNSLRLWDAKTTKPIGSPMLHDDRVIGAALDAGESRILSWSKDGTVRLWSPSTGRQIAPPMDHGDWVMGANFDRYEARVLTWTRNGIITVWKRGEIWQPGSVMTHDGQVMGVTFDNSETRLLSWSQDKTARIWDAETGEMIGSAMTHYGAVRSAVFDQGEKRVLTSSEDGSVQLWDLTSGRATTLYRHDDKVYGAIFGPGDKHVLSWGKDKTVRLWDMTSSKAVSPTLSHGDIILGAAFTRDARHILTWGNDNTVRMWPLPDSGSEPVFTHDDRVVSAVMTNDGKRLLSAGQDGTVRLWDITSGAMLGQPMRHEGEVSGAVFSSDEQHILSWSSDRTVRLWDTVTGRQVGSALRHGDSVLGAAFDGSGNRVLSWGSDNSIRLWDLATGRQLGDSLSHDSPVDGAFFYNKDQRILSWSGATVHYWEVATGLQAGPTLNHNGNVSGALISENEELILSWSNDNTIRIWDAAGGQQLGPDLTHDDWVNGAVLIAAHDRLLSWSGNEIRIRRFGADLDIPLDLANLQAKVTTGLSFDLLSREAVPIHEKDLAVLRETYLQKAVAHYLVCRYRQHNLFGMRYPELARLAKDPQ